VLKYVALVVCNGLLSYAQFSFASSSDSSAITAKLIAEGLLFLANFAIQRDFVFTSAVGQRGNRLGPILPTVPRRHGSRGKYTTRVLVDMIRRYGTPSSSGLSIVEIGGANSCFVERYGESDSLLRRNRHQRIRSSPLARRARASPSVRLYCQSVLIS
jgi:hypothetical protein